MVVLKLIRLATAALAIVGVVVLLDRVGGAESAVVAAHRPAPVRVGESLGRVALEPSAPSRPEADSAPALAVATPETEPEVAAHLMLPSEAGSGPSRWLAVHNSGAWAAGQALFARSWTDEEGLGAPGFNAEGCAVCHHDPVPGGAGGEDFNVFSSAFGDTASGYHQWMKQRGRQLTVMRERRATLKEKGKRSRFVVDLQTPSLLGLGLIDMIGDEEIVSREDPEDLDGDGIRGRAGRVDVKGTLEVGRFGWRADVPRLADFVCLALAGEVGLTTPDQGRGFGVSEDGDSAPDPELSQEEFDQLALFSGGLAPPTGTPRSEWSSDAIVGEELFLRIGCAACHVPVLHSESGVAVPLYSDLLLHEVLVDPETRSSSLSKARRAALLKGFRTPPLWGIGQTAPYLHDGRAETLEDAILEHAGEALATRDTFVALDELSRRSIVAFLEVL